MTYNEKSTLNKLPQHAQNLLTAFFNTKRLSANTRIIYIKAMQSYHNVVSTPLQETCNQNLSLWYNTVSARLESYTLYLNTIKLRTLYTFHLQQEGKDEEEASQKAKKLFKVIPLAEIKREAEKKNELRNKIVSPVEFQQLLNSSNHPRLRAFLVTAAESGARPEELCQTRIRDLQFHERYAQIIVNGKTGERTIPLIRSITYLRAWLQVHPDKHNPDAPLFAVIHKGKIIFPKRNTIVVMFHRLREKAGIKRRLYPYMLRHTRLTDLAERNIGEFAMKAFAGWTADSKMASRYVHFSGRTSLKAVLEIEGVALPKRESHEDYVKTKTCPRCTAENEADATYCSKCSLVLDETVLHAKQQEITKTDTLMDQLMQHPTVQQAIKDAVKELWQHGKLGASH